MYTIEEKTTFVGISELRTKQAEVLKALKKTRVILEKRNQPVAVLLSLKDYQEMEQLLEKFEDQILEMTVLERAQKKNKKWVSAAEAFKKVGL